LSLCIIIKHSSYDTSRIMAIAKVFLKCVQFYFESLLRFVELYKTLLVLGRMWKLTFFMILGQEMTYWNLIKFCVWWIYWILINLYGVCWILLLLIKLLIWIISIHQINQISADFMRVYFFRFQFLMRTRNFFMRTKNFNPYCFN